MKLLKIEWIKFKGHSFSVIGTGLYVLCMLGLVIGIGTIVPFGNNKSEAGGIIELSSFGDMGFYGLPDIWQNITYMAGWFKFIPAFIVIFFVANEFKFKTYRQSLIDGLSTNQFYSAKLITTLAICILSTLVVGLTGLVEAKIYNPDAVFADYLVNIDFLFAYFAEVLFLTIFAVFLTIAMRSSTIAIIFLLLYYALVEPTLGYFLEPISMYLPTRPSRELINEPFTRLSNLADLIGVESISKVPLSHLLLTLGYTVVFALGGLFILKKRDA